MHWHITKFHNLIPSDSSVLLYLVLYRCWPNFTCWPLEGGVLQDGPWWQGVPMTAHSPFQCMLVVAFVELFGIWILCRTLLPCLEPTHLEGPGPNGVVGENQKQNIQYVLIFFMWGCKAGASVIFRQDRRICSFDSGLINDRIAFYNFAITRAL